MRLNDIERLVAAGRAAAYQIRNALAEIHTALETSGATRLLTGIDICNTEIAASAIGTFSLYESRLQSAYGWKYPFTEVKQLLLSSATPNLAEEFENFRLAVNVLKHGIGDSHTKLLARANQLPFRVQRTIGDLVVEGDCCPPSDLVLVSPEFLELCCDAIEKSWAVVETAMQHQGTA